MPDAGKPAGEESLLSAPFEWMTGYLLKRSFRTGLTCLLLAALSLLVARRYLEYRTNRLDLINPRDAKNQLWLEYISEFGADDDAVIVVEAFGEAPLSKRNVELGRQRIVPALQFLSAQVNEHPELFHSILHEIDLSVLQSKPLHFFPPQQLAGIQGFVKQILPIVNYGAWDQLGLLQTLEYMQISLEQAKIQGANELQSQRLQYQIGQLNQGLYTALSGGTGDVGGWVQAPLDFSAISNLRNQYLVDQEGRLGFIFLKLANLNETSFARGEKPITELRRLIERASIQFPDVSIGLTGLPVMEFDEMRLSQQEMTDASILGMICVFVLFAAGFGGLRHAFLGMIALIVGMCWSLGAIALYPGHLNILSSAFALVLIGSGINYPIHYIARYLVDRRHHAHLDTALRNTSRHIGPGILSGAVTTSMAFFAASFTDFTGVAELGLIGGAGLLLCLVSTMVLLPILIRFLDGAFPRMTLPECMAMERWIAPVQRYPRLVTVGVLLLTAVCGLGIFRAHYDHNLLKLQPVGLSSVELEQRLLEEYNQSVWFALSLSNSREELLAKEQAFRKLATVERTESLDTYLPSVYPANRKVIAEMGAALRQLPERPGEIAIPNPDLLANRLLALEQELQAQGNGILAAAIFETRGLLRSLAPEAIEARLSGYQQQIAGDLLTRLHTLRTLSDPNPPTLADLPQDLVKRFVGAHGKFLLKVYAKGNAWDMDALGKFVRDVRSVDPRATGNPLQTFEASRNMQRSYEQATLYALLWIVVAIFLDFRHVFHTFLALLPLLAGLIQTIGLLGWCGIPLNPANMIALPLLVGLGTEDGIHLMYDFRQRQGHWKVTRGVAVAVVLTSATTVASFVTLLICSHRGLFSLGRVMTIGSTCCLLTSFTLLPAILYWMQGPEQAKEDTGSSDTSDPTTGSAEEVAASSTAHFPSESAQAPGAENEPGEERPSTIRIRPSPRWRTPPAA